MTASPPSPVAPSRLDAHRVTGRVQRLVADDDRVQVEVVLGRVPAPVADAAEQFQQFQGIDTAAPRDAVLPVGRERHVAGAERAAGADLGRFLAEQGRPEAELALALQRDRLGVHPAHQDQIAVQTPELGGGDVERVTGMLDPLAFRGEELDQLLGGACIRRQPGCCGRRGGQRRRNDLLCGGLCGGRTAGFDGHVPLLDPRGRWWDRHGRPGGCAAVRLWRTPFLRERGAVVLRGMAVGGRGSHRVRCGPDADACEHMCPVGRGRIRGSCCY